MLCLLAAPVATFAFVVFGTVCLAVAECTFRAFHPSE